MLSLVVQMIDFLAGYNAMLCYTVLHSTVT